MSLFLFGKVFHSIFKLIYTCMVVVCAVRLRCLSLFAPLYCRFMLVFSLFMLFCKKWLKPVKPLGADLFHALRWDVVRSLFHVAVQVIISIRFWFVFIVFSLLSFYA